MSIRSQPIRNGQIIEKKRKPPKIGFLSPRGIERAFMVVLYAFMLSLVVLSVIGTFYGLNRLNAPLAMPLQVATDIAVAPGRLGVAVGLQIVLTIVQYGARQMAHYDARWWLLYLVSLGVSLYYNIQAYWVPLLLYVSVPIAVIILVGGDVLPEFLAVRRPAPQKKQDE